MEATIDLMLGQVVDSGPLEIRPMLLGILVFVWIAVLLVGVHLIGRARPFVGSTPGRVFGLLGAGLVVLAVAMLVSLTLSALHGDEPANAPEMRADSTSTSTETKTPFLNEAV